MTHSVSLPPPVETGDCVGVAALSGPVEAESLEAGVEGLRELGFEPLLAENLSERRGLFAGSDDSRLAAFHDLVANDRVKAVFFARGGHGILRLLPRFDWNVLRRPLAYVGYSDLTPLLNLVVARLSCVAFHGPMVAVDIARGLDSVEKDSLLSALVGKKPVALPIAGFGMCRDGMLVGGCLSLLNAVVGTSYQLDGGGKIVFWEDVDEPLYRLDRMLTQLRLSGSLAGVTGLVIGRLDESEEKGDSDLIAGLLEQWGQEFSCPIGYGVASGHGRPNLTLPLGLHARIDPGRGELSFPDGLLPR